MPKPALDTTSSAEIRSSRDDATPTLMCSPFNPEEPFTPPARSYEDDAGLDLVVSRFVPVPAKAVVRLPHNLVLAPPPKFYCSIVPRGSTASRLGLVVLTGTVDPGFRGEVQTVVYNPRNTQIMVNAGERVSQLLIHRQPNLELSVAASLKELLAERPGSRGEAGWGSTTPHKKG